MSDTSIAAGAGQSVGGGAAGRPAATAPAATLPPLLLNTQYVRSMGFNVPGAPGIYAAVQDLRPHITLGIDVQVRRAEDRESMFEVTLLMHCTGHVRAPVAGEAPPPVAFVVDLAYSGVFTLQAVAPEVVEPVLMAECPRLLFPFARAVLADITREAGFPPVLLQPFDFITFWQGKRAANAAAAAAAASAAPVAEPAP